MCLKKVAEPFLETGRVFIIHIQSVHKYRVYISVQGE